MAEDEIQVKKHKKWHQRWWGVIFLIFLAVVFFYSGVFIYQVVALVESKNNFSSQEAFVQLQESMDGSFRAQVETIDDPFSGPVDAPLVIVEFSDFQCPYCKEAYPIIKRIRTEYPDTVKIIYRDFTNLTNHPDAINAAVAGECAAEQDKFWPYHDLLFDNQSDLSLQNLKNLAAGIGVNVSQFNNCLDNNKYLGEVQNDLIEGAKFGASGTPTFFINGIKVPGVIPYEKLKELIDVYVAKSSK